MPNRSRESEERRNNKFLVAIYTAGIVCIVALLFFSLIDLFRGIPIWDNCCVFFLMSTVYNFMMSQAKSGSAAVAYERRSGVYAIIAVICMIMYVVFK